MHLTLILRWLSHGVSEQRRIYQKCTLLKLNRLMLCVFIQCVIVHSTPVASSEGPMLADLEALASTLPGSYSNSQQYLKHVQKGLPPNQRHLLIKSEIYKMSSPMFNDSFTFYFQDFTKYTSEPFRSGFYSFSMEKKMNVLRMRALRLKSGDFSTDTFGRSDNFTLNSDMAAQKLKENSVTFTDLRTYSACDMYWKRLAEATFVGITGPQCLGTLGNDQIRIGVSMTLTADKLLLTEGWYRLKDGIRITEVKVPYILMKLRPSFIATTVSPKLITSTATTAPRIVYSSEAKKKTTRSKNRKVDRESGKFRMSKERVPNDQGTRKIRRKADDRMGNKDMKQQILHNFRQISTALTTGHDVYFRVELSACSAPDQARVEKLSFGGTIKDYIYVTQAGSKSERKEFILFVTRKTVMGNEGPEIITRQITVLREGRVRVEVIKTFYEPGRIKQSHIFDCRLYSEEKGYGGVKLATNPRRQVREIDRFAALTSFLSKGRDLFVIADLSRCQESRLKPAIVVGSRITDYDFAIKGKALEIFIPLVTEQEGRHAASPHSEGFSTHIFKNGDVTLSYIGSSNQSKYGLVSSSFQLSPAYHCKLSSAVETNDENGQSVKVFYSK